MSYTRDCIKLYAEPDKANAGPAANIENSKPVLCFGI